MRPHLRFSRRLPRAPRRAAVAVEFALCLAIGLMPVLFGIFDWSWYLYRAMTVQSMFHKALRAGSSVDFTTGSCPRDVAESTFSDLLATEGFSGATISSEISVYSYGGGGTTNVNQMLFTYSVPFTPIVGFVYTPPAMAGSLMVALEDQTNDPADYGCS